MLSGWTEEIHFVICGMSALIAVSYQFLKCRICISGQAYKLMFGIHRRAGRNDGAKACLQEVLRLEPGNAQVIQMLQLLN